MKSAHRANLIFWILTLGHWDLLTLISLNQGLWSLGLLDLKLLKNKPLDFLNIEPMTLFNFFSWDTHYLWQWASHKDMCVPWYSCFESSTLEILSQELMWGKKCCFIRGRAFEEQYSTRYWRCSTLRIRNETQCFIRGLWQGGEKGALISSSFKFHVGVNLNSN